MCSSVGPVGFPEIDENREELLPYVFSVGNKAVLEVLLVREHLEAGAFRSRCVVR